MRVKMVKLKFFDEQLDFNFQGLSKGKATKWLHSLFLVRSSYDGA